MKFLKLCLISVIFCISCEKKSSKERDLNYVGELVEINFLSNSKPINIYIDDSGFSEVVYAKFRVSDLELSNIKSQITSFNLQPKLNISPDPASFLSWWKADVKSIKHTYFTSHNGVVRLLISDSGGELFIGYSPP